MRASKFFLMPLLALFFSFKSSTTVFAQKPKLVLATNIYFETNRYDLNVESMNDLVAYIEALEELGVLDDSSVVIKLRGYSCEGGTNEYNTRLSEKRTKAVADYLILNDVFIWVEYKVGVIDANASIKESRMVEVTMEIP